MALESFAKFSCTYCLDELTGIRIKCVVCADFHLCLQCFSTGAEIGPHKSDHSYQFADPGGFDIFRSKTKWTNSEELDLLEGIERYGFGNWEDISQRIKTRTPDEARDEYMGRYVEGSIGRATWPPAYERRSDLKDLTVGQPPEVQSTSLPPLDVTPEEASQLGYMPHRDDFETEYQNEAEALVSQLNLNTLDEDDLDVALKLAHVDMYMEKMSDRTRIKKVCHDYQFVSKFFIARRDRPVGRRKTSAEQEVEDRLRCTCRFLTATEYDSLVRSVQRQKDLEQRLSELLRYRRSGLTRIEELAHYEQEVARNKGSGSSWEHSRQIAQKRKREEKKGPDTHCSTTRKSTCPTDNPTSSHEPERRQERRQLQQRQRRPQHRIVIPEPTHLLSSVETQNPQEETESTIEKQIQEHVKSNGWLLNSVNGSFD